MRNPCCMYFTDTLVAPAWPGDEAMRSLKFSIICHAHYAKPGLRKMSEEFVDAFRATLGPDTCWVLFANGTVVILPNPASKSRESLAEDAKAFIKQNGPVVPGTPLGG